MNITTDVTRASPSVDRLQILVKVNNALTLAIREMRKELRWMLEVGGDASRKEAPKMDQLSATEREMIADVLEALRACNDCLDLPIEDDQPTWLDDVIAGRLV
ncbi:hypothetical protein KZZ08_00685 [Roseovarius mucosus]|uniref:hypothetical protein n=1 Tax=Roseovarius mucosus TaxID=215743 RepID=UPI001C5FAAFB|nr:hypothetical protein [Roseovarius mucosus]MBW4972112.1 hypothetical protein [Roseovarius mucosus]